MSFIVPEDLRFPTPTSKAHLEHCGKYFCTNLEKSFMEVSKKTVSIIDAKIKNTTAFNEKQVLHDLKKKIHNESSKLVQVFRSKIETELNNQLSLDYRLHGKPIWWRNLADINKEEFGYKEYLVQFENTLGEKFKKDISQLKKRINCITGVEQEIFGANVIMKAIIATLKEQIQSQISLYYGVLFLGTAWADEINNIVTSLNSYLIENNVVPKIEDYEEIYKGIKQLPKSWGWEKEGSYIDKETASRTTVYGSMAIPVNLDLPSLNDFLSGKTTKIEEKIAVPRFEPINSESKIEEFKIDNPKEELKEEAKNETKPSISDILDNIEEARVQTLGEKDRNVFSWTDYVPKIARILTIQEKNSKVIDVFSFSFSEVKLYEQKDTDSSLSKNEEFIEISTNIQKKIRRVDFFQDNGDTLSTDIFEDFLTNKTLNAEMSEYDRYVCNFLSSVFKKLITNPNVSLIGKSIYYKLQIPLWHIIISDKSFFTTKDNAPRLLMELLVSNELTYNISLLEKIEDLISSSKYRYRNAISYFNGLLDEILAITDAQNRKEDSLLKELTDEYKEATTRAEIYRLVVKTIKNNIDKTAYEPVRSFIEKIWAKSFVNKYYTQINSSFNTIDGLLKNLNISAKLNWQQSMVAFEAISMIANNSDNTPAKISKMKELLSKANTVLPKICIELGIDTNYMKALLALLKYKVDSYSKTSNEVMLAELMNKIKPNEEMYISASEEYTKSLSGNTLIKVDGVDIVNPLKLQCSLNKWYFISHEHMKLKYTTQDKEFLFFMLSKDTFATESFTKNKINNLTKNNEARIIEDNSVFGSFTLLMLLVNKELTETVA